MWLAAGCASVEREAASSAVSDAPPAATPAAEAVASVTNAPPAGGYAWEELARLAAANSSEAKALLLEAEAERYQTAVDTAWKNPQLRLGRHGVSEDETTVKRGVLGSESGDSSFSGETAGLRVYTSNPFVNRWLRKRGVAAAQALRAKSAETAYAVFCEVRSLCLEAEMAREEIALLERMAAFREQARDFRKEQSDAGVTDALELIRSETRLASLRSEIRERQVGRQQVLRRLAVLAGVPASQLTLRPPAFEKRVRPEYLDPQALTALAFLRRPDLARSRHEQEAAALQVRASQAGQVPWFEYVEGTFESEKGSEDSFDPNGFWSGTSNKDETEWQVRVAMTLPVFNWLGAEVKLSRAQLAAASARADGLHETIRAEVGGVFEDYQEARAERDRLADECRRLQGTLSVRIDALAQEAAAPRESVLAAQEELIAYQRVCLKAERECLRMEQYLETVSGGVLTQE